MAIVELAIAHRINHTLPPLLMIQLLLCPRPRRCLWRPRRRVWLRELLLILRPRRCWLRELLLILGVPAWNWSCNR